MLGVVFGALGPVGWAVGAAVTVASIVVTMSDSDDDNYVDEEEVIKEYKKDKRKKLESDIDKYIQKSIEHIKMKYNIDISIEHSHIGIFNGVRTAMIPEIKIHKEEQSLTNAIKELEMTVEELQELKKELLKAKNEVLG